MKEAYERLREQFDLRTEFWVKERFSLVEMVAAVLLTHFGIALYIITHWHIS